MKTYLKQMSCGHNPKVKEHDIRYGFKMQRRTEKFDMDLTEIDAHTFQIMEIIEQEKSQIKQKQRQEIKNNASSGRTT